MHFNRTTNQLALKYRLVAAMTLFAAMFGGAAVANAQSTAFTYQGQLKSAGVPANGDYDMVFRIFDAAVAGNQMGIDLPSVDQPVVNGLFTVRLDAGPAIFLGERWLEIEVNGQVLAPRQEITSTPFAQTCNSSYYSDIAGYANAPWETIGSNISYINGYVGVGIGDPTAMLEIGGVAGVDGIKFPDGTLQTTAAIGGGDSIWSMNGTSAYYNAGKVGIGDTTPDAKLDITGNWDGNDGALTLRGSKPTLKLHGGTSPFYHSWIMHVYNGFTGNGSLAFYHQGAPNGAWTNFFNLSNFGDVGIGTPDPLAKLDITSAGQGAQLLRFSTERPWVFRQIYTGPSTGLQLLSTSGQKPFEITCLDGTNVATFMADQTNPRVGIGTTTPGTTLDVNGTTRTKVLQITGADLAEKFPTSGGKTEPGMVMEIDPDNAGLLRVSREPYNHRVAGIVSGANEFAAGAILGNLPGSEEAPPIALSGRVYVKCDATDAGISPGDLLTTSTTAGHAMKAVDRKRSHGAILGKAMTSLAKGERGLVLVLVSLQ